MSSHRCQSRFGPFTVVSRRDSTMSMIICSVLSPLPSNPREMNGGWLASPTKVLERRSKGLTKHQQELQRRPQALPHLSSGDLEVNELG